MLYKSKTHSMTAKLNMPIEKKESQTAISRRYFTGGTWCPKWSIGSFNKLMGSEKCPNYVLVLQ